MSVLLSIIVILCDRTILIESAPKLGDILFDPLSNEAQLSGTDIKNIIFNIMNNSFNAASTEEHKDLAIPSKLDLRKSEKSESTQKPSFGYDFNDSICKTVDDRVICGYDKNIGEVYNKIVDLGNGCTIRGDRLECGYLAGPFINPRRPPANEQDIEDNNQKRHNNFQDLKNNYIARSNPDISTASTSVIMLTSNTRKKSNLSSPIDIKASSRVVKNLYSVSSPTSLLTNTDFTSRSSTLTTSHVNIISVAKAAITKKNKKYCVEKNDHIFCYSIKS